MSSYPKVKIVFATLRLGGSKKDLPEYKLWDSLAYQGKAPGRRRREYPSATKVEEFGAGVGNEKPDALYDMDAGHGLYHRAAVGKRCPIGA
jgi:hypothetical protein